MSLYERIVPVEAQILHEGIFDKHILKAIFLGGGMGSGKSFIAQLLFGKASDTRRHTSVGKLGASFGLKSLSVDEIYEFRAKQKGLDIKTAFKLPPREPNSKFDSHGREIHNRAWYTMMDQRSVFTRGRLGLLIDGTAKDYDYVMRGVKELRDLGYDCSMIMVTTPLERAREFNRKRGREVPDDDLIASHKAVAGSAQRYKTAFKGRYFEIPNVENYDTEGAEFKTTIEPDFHRVAMKILGKTLENPIGKKWVADRLAGAPAHLKKGVYRGLGIRYVPDAVTQLGKLVSEKPREPRNPGRSASRG